MDKKILVLIGAVVMIVGLFLPMIADSTRSMGMLLPPEGGVEWRGVVMLVLALAAAGLALAGQVKHALWPGVAALGFLAYLFFDVKGKLDRLQEVLSQIGPETSFSRDMTMHLASLGWIVLGAGAVIVIVSAAMAWKGGSPPSAI